MSGSQGRGAQRKPGNFVTCTCSKVMVVVVRAHTQDLTFDLNALSDDDDRHDGGGSVFEGDERPSRRSLRQQRGSSRRRDADHGIDFDPDGRINGDLSVSDLRGHDGRGRYDDDDDEGSGEDESDVDLDELYDNLGVAKPPRQLSLIHI